MFSAFASSLSGQSSLGTLFVRLTADSTALITGMNSAERAVVRSALFMGKSIGALPVAFAAAGAVVSAIALKMSSDFSMVLTKMETLANVQRGQVAEWREDILNLATDTGNAPKALAEAMYFVTSAGLRGKTALEALTASAQASAIGLGETRVVADAVTSAINAYGAANLSAARATNVLALAVEAGKMEASSLAPVMGRVIPIAAAMKISLEDVTGVLAVMSRTGMSSYQAATSLAQVMSDMLKPSHQAQEVLGQIGISMAQVRDMVARPGGLLEALRLLSQKTKDFDDEALSRVFSDMRAFRGLMNVLTQDAEQVDYVMGRVASGVDLLGKGMERMAQEPGFQMKQMFAELSAILIRMGDQVAPVFLAFIQSFGGVEGAARSAAASLKGFYETLGPALVATVGAIGDVFYGLHLVLKGLEIAFLGLQYVALKVANAIAVVVTGSITKSINTFYETIDTAIAIVNSLANTNIPEIKIRAKLEVTDLEKGMKSISASLTQAQEDFTRLGNLGSFSDRITAQFQKITTNITAENKKVLDDTTRTYKQISQTIESYTDETAKLVQMPDKSSPGLRGMEDPLLEQNRLVAEEIRIAKDKFQTLKELAQMEEDITGKVSAEKIKLGEAYLERLKQLRMAEAQVLIGSGKQMMDELLTVTEGFAGKQSDAYKAMFAASKAFAIAEAGVKIMQGVAQAASMPWPSNLAAMASVVAATASIISNIQSIKLTFAGGKAEGGPVSTGKSYLVGEEGPEMFVPSQRGNIIPNDQLGGREMKVVVNNYTDIKPEVNKHEENGETVVEVVLRRVKTVLSSEVRDGRGDFTRAMEHTFGLKRGTR
jgi:TP901 family phage tail tape measure protein